MAQKPNSPEQLQEAVDRVAAIGTISAAAAFYGVKRKTLSDRYHLAKSQGYVPQNQALASYSAANPLPEGSTPSNAPPELFETIKVSTQVNAAGETEKQWIQNRIAPGAEFEPLPGHYVKAESALVDQAGNIKIKWIKTDTDKQLIEEKQQAVLRALIEKITPVLPTEWVGYATELLLSLYTITDSHVGMLAWDKETGEDWDLAIAEECLVQTFIQMIDAAPRSDVAVINELGDFLHFDSLTPETPAHRHVLDADSRYQKVVEAAVRVLRKIIDYALTKHRLVRVLLCEGNHDPAGSVWLRVMFAQLYANEPRVHVEKSPNPYVAYLHGQTLLGFHHGHLTKKANLPQIFAAKFRTEWGTSTHAYIHTGHLHHVEEKEHPGVNVVQHATLAAPDAYAARGGWLSKRQATRMDYHTIKGEVGRGIFVPFTRGG